MSRYFLLISSWFILILSSISFAGNQRLSLFIDKDFSGLQTISLHQVLKKQYPSLNTEMMDLVSVEALLFGKGQILLALDADQGKALEIEQDSFLDFYTLPMPAKAKQKSNWALWLSGELYIESLDVTLQDRQPGPLPDKVSCPGAWGQVEFVVTQAFSSFPKIEVIGHKDFVWVMTGFGDRHLGPWLASYPNRANFKGGAKHWKADGKNHWQFQVPRTYSSSGFGSGRVYFMVDAVNDNPYAGTIVDWCDL